MNTPKNPIFLTILILWLGHFLVDMMLGIWPIYKTVAHLDLAIVGIIGGVCAFMGEGLQVIFGTLSDRGYRKVLILCGLVATTANAFFIYTGNYWTLFVLYLVTSIGSGAFHPAAISMMGDLSLNRRGLLIALFVSGGYLGMALSQGIYSYVHFNIEGQVVWLAIPAFILAVITIFVRIQGHSFIGKTEKIDADKHVGMWGMLQFFRNRSLCFLYFCQVCNATLLWGTMFLLPDLLSSRGYESWVAFGGGHMVFILGAAIMMVPAGYLADRFSSRAVILTATALGMLLFYTLLYLPLLGEGMTLLLLGGIGAALGVVNPVSVALGTRLVPNQKGMVAAFLMGMVWCVSEGIGQGGGGLLTKLFVEDAPAKALAILGFLFLIGLTMAFQLPEKESEESAVETIPSI